MKSTTKFLRGVALLSALGVLASGSLGRAQVSPVGGDHVSVGPGAGLVSPVSPTGAFQASVPLDLPSPRGALPVPLEIRYTGGAHVGAVGAGWDLPLWTVRRSATTWHRKPAIASNEAGQDHVPERIFVSLGGRTLYMVPSTQPGVWIPFLSDQYMELRAGGSTSWTLSTGGGTDYVFTVATSIGGGDLDDDNVWVLTEIRDRRSTDRVTLHYETRPGDELDLVKLQYAYGGLEVPLYEVALTYAAPNPDAPIQLGLVDTERGKLVRTRVLDRVAVRARNNLAGFSTPRAIRSYSFEYEPDPDTELPRLARVDVHGEEGSGTTLPVARYRYGAATNPKTGLVHYGAPMAIPRHPDAEAVGAVDLASSTTTVHDIGIDVFSDGKRETVRSRHTIRDFTGDGVPDLVFKAGDTWHLHAGKVTDGGLTLSSGVTTSWTQPREIHVQQTTRFDKVHDAMVTTETLVQYLDWDGDGRVDVIDADGAGPNKWRVWLNRAAANGTPTWSAVDVDVSDLRDHIQEYGLGTNSQIYGWDESRIALERSRSWPRSYVYDCNQKLWTPSSETGWFECANSPDQTPPGQLDTVVEWTLDDVNGDRFPDIVANTNAAMRCDVYYPAVNEGWDMGNVDATSFCDNEQVGLEESLRTCERHRWQWLTIRGDCRAPGVPNDGPDVEYLPNEARVLLNRNGALTGFAAAPRTYGATVSGEASAGIIRWTTGAPADGPIVEGIDLSKSWRAAGFVDYHANGVRRYFLSEHSSNWYERFESTRHEVCVNGASSSTQFTSRQTGGLADLNGDGSPDHVYEDSPGSWRVRFGGTAGFGPERAITFPSSFPFAISETTGTCGGGTRTTAGLIDVDGDGAPELVRTIDGILFAAEILSSNGRTPAGLTLGRLTSIENGYGARTAITYANNKAEPYTPHQVPAPEVVVAAVQTYVDDGSAPHSVPVRYAYGTAESRFDPISGRVAFAGYRRHVALIGDSTERTGPTLIEGIAVVTDHHPPAAFSAGFPSFALGGRPHITSRFEGLFNKDPREMLVVPPQDSRLRGRATVAHAVKELPVAPWTDGALGALECNDVDPASGTALLNDLLCHRAGIVYQSASVDWDGLEDPQFGQRNALRGRNVLAVDDLGRPTELELRGDLRTLSDDRCITIQYAAPASSAARFTSVVSGMWTSDCGWTNPVWVGGTSGGYWLPGQPILITGVRYTYDGLPEGQYSLGRRTERIVERYDTTDGSSLGEYVAETLSYDAHGEVRQVTASREIGSPATRTTTFARDAFDLTVRTVTESSTDVATAPFVRQRAVSVWPSVPEVYSGLNGESTTTYRDGFGRPVRVEVTAPGYTHVASSTIYDDATSGRRVTTTTYPGKSDAGITSQVVLDALGRARFEQAELGADYAGKSLVAGLTEYDAWGRPIYEAAPFEWSGTFAMSSLPADRATWPYGVTAVYDVGGRLVRSVEATGIQPGITSTSVAQQRFVTDYTHSWEAGAVVTSVSGPTENDPSAVTFNARDVLRTTAVGLLVERARHTAANARIDLVRHDYDRLGNQTTIRRYRAPSTGAEEVLWRRRYDSLGQLLQLDEPASSPVTHRYDEFGGQFESSWNEGGTRKLTRRWHDGFGRLSVEQLINVNVATGDEAVEWTSQAWYDEHSGSSLQPAGSFVGRLSRLEAIGHGEHIGTTYLSYDALGRSTHETYTLAGSPSVMRAGWTYLPGGLIEELRLETPAGTDRFAYGYDSAARNRTITDVDQGLAVFEATTVDSKGRYRNIRLGNGVTESFSFAPSGRESLTHWSASTTTEARWTAFDQRDAEGRVVVERFYEGGIERQTTNTYDTLDRLSQQQTREVRFFPPPALTETFGYNPLGNLTTRRSSQTSSLNRDYWSDTTDRDRLCRFVPAGQSNGPCNLQYDAIGNVHADTWSGTPRTLTYDAGGRFTAVQKGTWRASFLYGPGGALVRTEVRNGLALNRRTLRFGDLIEERTRSDGGVQYDRRIPGPLGIVATKRTQGAAHETVYVHGDPRGNRFFTRGNGTIVQSVRYAAYGSQLQSTGTPSSMTFTDDLWNGGDDLPELGVVVLGARLYDPTLQRFLQRDPIINGSGSSRGNPYSFAFNDPINYVDPTGLEGDCYGKECQGYSAGAAEFLLGMVYTQAFAQAASNNAARAATPRPDLSLLDGVSDDQRQKLDAMITVLDVLQRENPAVISLAQALGDGTRSFLSGTRDAILANLKCGVAGALVCTAWRAEQGVETGKALYKLASDPHGTACAAGRGDCLRGWSGLAVGVALGMLVDRGGIAINPALARTLSRFKKGVENVEHFGTLNDARHAARYFSGLGADAVDFVSDVGPLAGRITGRMSPDGLRGWRVDWDQKKGFHVNWWDQTASAKRKGWLYGANLIDGAGYDDLMDLLDHFPAR